MVLSPQRLTEKRTAKALKRKRALERRARSTPVVPSFMRQMARQHADKLVAQAMRGPWYRRLLRWLKFW